MAITSSVINIVTWISAVFAWKVFSILNPKNKINLLLKVFWITVIWILAWCSSGNEVTEDKWTPVSTSDEESHNEDSWSWDNSQEVDPNIEEPENEIIDVCGYEDDENFLRQKLLWHWIAEDNLDAFLETKKNFTEFPEYERSERDSILWTGTVGNNFEENECVDNNIYYYIVPWLSVPENIYSDNWRILLFWNLQYQDGVHPFIKENEYYGFNLCHEKYHLTSWNPISPNEAGASFFDIHCLLSRALLKAPNIPELQMWIWDALFKISERLKKPRNQDTALHHNTYFQYAVSLYLNKYRWQTPSPLNVREFLDTDLKNLPRWETWVDEIDPGLESAINAVNITLQDIKDFQIMYVQLMLDDLLKSLIDENMGSYQQYWHGIPATQVHEIIEINNNTLIREINEWKFDFIEWQSRVLPRAYILEWNWHSVRVRKR